MGLLDTPLRAAAKSVIGTLGTSVTLRQIALGTPNIKAGTQSNTATDTTVTGVLESYKNREVSDIVQATDRKLTIAASVVSFIPDLNDQVVISSVVYAIKDVQTVQAQDSAALLVLQLRAGG